MNRMTASWASMAAPEPEPERVPPEPTTAHVRNCIDGAAVARDNLAKKSEQCSAVVFPVGGGPPMKEEFQPALRYAASLLRTLVDRMP